MTTATTDTVPNSEQDQNSADDIVELGTVSNATHGSQFGWKIEAGVNPYWF
jgi:hypothetical protein